MRNDVFIFARTLTCFIDSQRSRNFSLEATITELFIVFFKPEYHTVCNAVHIGVDLS